MRFRKLGLNPLESVAAMDYCRTCQDEVDVEIDQGKWESLFVYRKRCLRCGHAIQWGVSRTEFSSAHPTTMQAVATWIRATGADRR